MRARLGRIGQHPAHTKGMNTHTASHQPAGRPDGGQFAPQPKPASGLRLVTDEAAAYEAFRAETDPDARWKLMSAEAIAAAESGLTEEPVTDAYEEPFTYTGADDRSEVMRRVSEQVEADGPESFGAIAFDEAHRLARRREQEHWGARYNLHPRPQRERRASRNEILDVYADEPAKRETMLHEAG